MLEKNNSQDQPPAKVALNPKQFAALFGREKTWAYRLIWRGRVKTVPDVGRKLIPATEAERLCKEAK